MEHSKGLKKYGNCILTFIVVALNIAVMGICFDFYYDLNDDTMMKDIMSGVYSGMPDGHNMQTLYPLGALIALCYRLCGAIPWYGLFLCLCQFGCFYLIGVRLCAMADSAYIPVRGGGVSGGQSCAAGKKAMGGRMILLLLLTLFLWGVCLPHFVSIQYTVSCAIMSATAIFWFYTTPKDITAQQFVVSNLPSVILVIVAYQLRTEMLLLTFPFICLAGLYRMVEEKELFARETLCKYGAVLGMILVGMFLSSAADYAAYSEAEWKDFRDFFDARTTVYDFYPELVTGEMYSSALTELGVTSEQQALLNINNYNFGLDDAIDTSMLMRMADYASHTLGQAKDWAAIFKGAVSFYIYRTFHGQDAPYNIIVLWAYIAVAAAGFILCHKNKADDAQMAGRRIVQRYAFAWQLVLLAAVRSAIWMFILMRGRDPVRITHSLYLVEAALLLAILIRMLCSCRMDMKRDGVMRGMGILLVLLMAGSAADSISQVRDDQTRREWTNTGWYEIDAYCREHTENFYFEDVYSTVSFSQKIFGGTDNGYANYDIMGGWMCKSPLYKDKLSRYHIISAKEALLGDDNVYLIISDTEALDRGFGWLIDFYESQGVGVTVEETDKIGEYYSVYKIREK
ncbi:MAG: hypothetical protein K2J99_07140 [Lachnospiraceae bacterium]|nr:hypothetical protein [Lachnospiraceae bacterium]